MSKMENVKNVNMEKARRDGRMDGRHYAPPNTHYAPQN